MIYAVPSRNMRRAARRETLGARYPDKRIHVVAVSLGGNVLLKYLGENSRDSLIDSAIAVSVPFDLAKAAKTLDKGTAKIYQRYLLHRLQASFYEKCKLMDMPIRIPDKNEITTIYHFDDLITSPLHGFTGADDYYAKCSSRQFIPSIKTPTLIIHATDDPFMTPDVIPVKSEIPPDVRFELHQHGGHLGFIAGKTPLIAHYWLDERIERQLNL